MLKLKDGWKALVSPYPADCGAMCYFAPSADTSDPCNAHVIDYTGCEEGNDDDASVYTRPNGSHSYTQFVESLDDAHAYLLNAGSESPWEEMPA